MRTCISCSLATAAHSIGHRTGVCVMFLPVHLADHNHPLVITVRNAEGSTTATAENRAAAFCRPLDAMSAMPSLVSCELSFRELTSVVHGAGYASVDRVI